MSFEEEEHVVGSKLSGGKRRYDDDENAGGAVKFNPQRIKEKSGRLKGVGQQMKLQQRAFGNVLQEKHLGGGGFSNKGSFYKPNPNERLWNPSPSKRHRPAAAVQKVKSVVVVERRSGDGDVEEGEVGWRRGHYDDKENETNTLQTSAPTACVIPYNENDSQKIPQLSSDLNNSFTEKISNLDICSHSILSDSSVSSPPPATPRVLLNSSPTQESNARSSSTTEPYKLETWVETLDPDYPYITEILNYWHTLELTQKINPKYMNKQKEISYKMRTILVDWLVEVAEEYRIGDATLHRAVHFVDRFLSKLQISRGNLQLLGTTCLFIACKVEEIQPPDTSDLVYITDNTYDKTQLLRMECLVLSVLDFDLLTPTAYEFTEYFSNTLQLTHTAKEFSHYVIELTLLDGEKFLKFTGCVLGMTACYVAIRCCGDSYDSKNNKQQKHQIGSLPEILSRVKRLNSNAEFENLVEEAAGHVFFTLLSAGRSSNTKSDLSPSNSVCNKHKQFQEQRFVVAAAAAAACSTIPWILS